MIFLYPKEDFRPNISYCFITPKYSVNSWGFKIIGISQITRTIRLRENFAYEIRRYIILHLLHFYRKEVNVSGMNRYRIIFLQKFIKG